MIFTKHIKTFYNPETALLKVLSDLLLIVNSGDSVALVLMDLMAAFVTINPGILLDCLEHVCI